MKWESVNDALPYVSASYKLTISASYRVRNLKVLSNELINRSAALKLLIKTRKNPQTEYFAEDCKSNHINLCYQYPRQADRLIL
jgi:hypothetical protein